MKGKGSNYGIPFLICKMGMITTPASKDCYEKPYRVDVKSTCFWLHLTSLIHMGKRNGIPLHNHQIGKILNTENTRMWSMRTLIQKTNLYNHLEATNNFTSRYTPNRNVSVCIPKTYMSVHSSIIQPNTRINSGINKSIVV